MFKRCCALVLLITGLLLTPTAATALGRPERTALSMVNRSRRAHDVHPVRTRSRITRYAERHTRSMARRRTLFHSAMSLPGFHALGEIVGYGSSVAQVHRAFMRSAPHRQIILGSWRWAGIGVVKRGGRYYVTEVFAR